ncbi:MAG TPA: PEGA domain-containing protein [Rhodothermales bacterium]|nr:PEGA domain-containing protein [Rhodothermales bacterium]HRR10233.1 PEGA domain-containing protein [Rhodothermales bacterium]
MRTLFNVFLISWGILFLSETPVWAQTDSTATSRSGEGSPVTISTRAKATLSEPDLSPYREKYALLVGINNYRDSTYRPLMYAVKDALTMRDILTGRFGYKPENITVLLNEEATKVRIEQAIERFSDTHSALSTDSVAVNAQLLIYFAGHGDTAGRSGNQMGYVIAYDTSPLSPMSSGIRMDAFRSYTEHFIPKHVLFLMDTCYGGLATVRGGSTAETRAGDIFIRNIWNLKGREIITAGGPKEMVVESDDWEHSAFMRVLVDALQYGKADKNGDNLIPVQELFGYITTFVPYYAEQKGGKQTPNMGAYSPDQGTFIFELEPGRLDNALMSGSRISNGDLTENVFLPKLVVKTNVDNARVFIDGTELGFTSNNIWEHRVKPGLHVLEVRKGDKYRANKQEFEIKPDIDLPLEVNLERMTTLVNFKVSPAHASITINNNDLIGSGNTSKEFTKGRYTFTVDAAGYKPKEVVVNLTEDEQTFTVELDKIVMVLSLYSLPDMADVMLDGKPLGKTPLQNVELGYGEHQFIVSKDKDYTSKMEKVVVQESGVGTKVIRLETTPQFDARKLFNKDRIGYIRSALVRGALGFSLYRWGYPAARKLYEENNTEQKETLKYVQYLPIGIGAILGIASFTSMKKAITLNYTKYLEQALSKKISVTLEPQVLGASLTVRL